MKYTESQVLNILKLVTDQPKDILDKWHKEKDNEYLDLTKYHYPLFLYSFPIIINGEEVATITLAQIHNTGVDGLEDVLMSKYLTTDIYNNSLDAFSHENYMSAYLSIHKEFKLTPHPKDNNFYAFESTFLDADGKEINYHLSFGYSEIPELYEKYISQQNGWCSYRFDNDINIQIKQNDFSGWEMGKKINEVIKARIRDQKIDMALGH